MNASEEMLSGYADVDLDATWFVYRLCSYWCMYENDFLACDVMLSHIVLRLRIRCAICVFLAIVDWLPAEHPWSSWRWSYKDNWEFKVSDVFTDHPHRHPSFIHRLYMPTSVRQELGTIECSFAYFIWK